ncbi:unnamed protein product [Ectocarpus sp. 8 AP-2014]
MCGGKLREKFHQRGCNLYSVLAPAFLVSSSRIWRCEHGTWHPVRSKARQDGQDSLFGDPKPISGPLKSLAETRVCVSGGNAALFKVSPRRRGFYRMCRSKQSWGGNAAFETRKQRRCACASALSSWCCLVCSLRVLWKV